MTYVFNMGWATASSSLHRNIIIFLKVYASVTSSEKLAKRGSPQKFRLHADEDCVK